MPESALLQILHVSHVGVMGGGEHSLLDLLHSLDRERFGSRVVLPAGGELAQRLQMAGVPIDDCAHLRRLYRSRRQALGQLWAVLLGGRSLRRLIRRRRPALVHASSTTAAFYLLAGPWRPRCPVIWHCRDLVIPATLCRWLARRSTRVVVPSRACQTMIKRLANKAKIELIPNGIEIESAPLGCEGLRRQLGIGGRPLVAVVGQLAPWKGHSLALAAARQICDQNPAVSFVLVGDDRFGDHPDALAQLEQQVCELGLTGSVHLLGYRHDVRSIIAGAELLLHPAFPEPFGRVVVEAMAAGCPVVACGGEHGPAELLRHGVDGLLVTPRTATALAAAVLELLERPALRDRLAGQARQRARTLYDRCLMGRRLGALYETVVAEQQLRSGKHRP